MIQMHNVTMKVDLVSFKPTYAPLLLLNKSKVETINEKLRFLRLTQPANSRRISGRRFSPSEKFSSDDRKCIYCSQATSHMTREFSNLRSSPSDIK